MNKQAMLSQRDAEMWNVCGTSFFSGQTFLFLEGNKLEVVLFGGDLGLPSS